MSARVKLGWREAPRAWARRFDQRAPRERLLLAAAAVAVALFLVDATLLGPALKSWQAASRQQQAARAAQLAAQTEIAQRQSQEQALLRARLAELDAWRRRVRDNESALQQHEATLIGPDRMLALLEQVLAQHGQIRVRAMHSLGRVDVLQADAARAAQAAVPAGTATASAATNAAVAAAAKAADSAAAQKAADPAAPPKAANPLPASTTAPSADPAQATLYRHGVELTLEGSFSELLAYLRALESMPQRVLFGKLDFRVEQHPKATLTLRLYTLSRDRHWLEI